ncbi:uncharacterized protein [Anabrus simplex]|uniref:uncharacterized protein n=1 Tax=Anabrus simplex TaxID=316456 RepID=UPI0035A3343A
MPRAFVFLMLGVILTAVPADAVVGLIRTLIRDNLAGKPVNFQVQEWRFDPYVAERMRPEYEALNGIRGEELIERFGLGEDGYTEQRRELQRQRDIGVYVSKQPRFGP